MAIIKCKMCGGDINLTAEKTFGTCEYCGSTMTFPKIDDEQRAAAFNRGNHFRRIGEFDKALAVYERIVSEDNTDAEAHWCCALCRFGIEYVEDPETYEYLPTCHRASFDSFLEDVDYLAALEHSDGITHRQYQRDGAKIVEVQRGILATSQSEEPFDVFICYKETDEDGQRTRDSLLAQEIYYQLTEQGYKVFFSRITLEDVAGTQYEPYIFAALNSAKVMVVVGTKPEHFSAVWVKNEWSRFLALMKKNRHKLLLPCYRDMDPYELPEQLSVLQAYDMAKIGFIQDLIRGIRKILDAEEKSAQIKKTVVVQQTESANVAPLLERAFMFLEDGDWDSANEYCEKVLDIDPKNSRAYLGKLMTELRVKKQEELKNSPIAFANSSNYHKVIRFGDESLKATLAGYMDHINTRNADIRKEGVYSNAKAAMRTAETKAAWWNAAKLFQSIPGYKDADAQALTCQDNAKDAIYEDAMRRMAEDDCSEYAEAIELLKTIPGWRDADAKLAQCEERMEELETEAETEYMKEKRHEKILIFLAVLILVMGAVLAAVVLYRLNSRYENAAALMAEGNFQAAITVFEQMPSYKNRDALLDECRYQQAIVYMGAEAYDEALLLLQKIPHHKDIANIRTVCETQKVYKKAYEDAVAAETIGERSKAAILYGQAQVYKDAHQKSMALWDQVAVRETISTGDDHTVALKEDGTVVAVGDNTSGRCSVSDWTDIVAISAGMYHTVGLKADGTVIAVGDNAYGRCSVSDWTDIVAISAGEDHTVALKKDGTVVAVGDNASGQCSVSDWTDIVAISTGYNHTVGLKADGTVITVGGNMFGQCNVSDWTDIVAISTGDYHTVALKEDGTVVAVGDNSDSQCNIDNWTDIVAISTGDYHTVGLKRDGTVVTAGFNASGQCNVSGWTDIVAISAGDYHTVGLKKDGTVVTAGNNASGQCNISDWTNIKISNK